MIYGPKSLGLQVMVALMAILSPVITRIMPLVVSAKTEPMRHTIVVSAPYRSIQLAIVKDIEQTAASFSLKCSPSQMPSAEADHLVLVRKLYLGPSKLTLMAINAHQFSELEIFISGGDGTEPDTLFEALHEKLSASFIIIASRTH